MVGFAYLLALLHWCFLFEFLFQSLGFSFLEESTHLVDDNDDGALLSSSEEVIEVVERWFKDVEFEHSHQALAC